MWDLLYDPYTQEWVGMHYWLSTDEASCLAAANPEFDARVVTLSDIRSLCWSDEEKAACAANNTTYILQITWSATPNMERLWANEYNDYWYAADVELGSTVQPTARLSAAHRFAAVGIVSIGHILEQYNLRWPKVMKVPVTECRPEAQQGDVVS
jgi:hypothetical protein